MVPTVFISSTIEDLHHVRDAVRETISELGYQPIMSEYGGVGYMNETAADIACYQSVKECQLMMLIIGKRYGSKTQESGAVSVTEHEYDTCMEHRPRLITFVDQEVLHNKRFFDDNQDVKTELHYRGMDDPKATFSFIDKVVHAPVRNAILPFSAVADVRSQLKNQLAALFHDLLNEHSNPSKSALDEIMGEVKTIRNALSAKAPPDMRFLVVFKFLLNEKNQQFRLFLNGVCEDIERVIPVVYEAKDFDDFSKRAKFSIEIVDEPNCFIAYKDKRRLVHGASFYPWDSLLEPEEANPLRCSYAIDSSGNAIMNTESHAYFVRAYADLKRRIARVAESQAQSEVEKATTASIEIPSTSAGSSNP